MKTLNFITGNRNKLSEVRAILGDAVVVDNKSVDVPEIQGTIEEIAKEKCRRAADAVCALCWRCLYQWAIWWFRTVYILIRRKQYSLSVVKLIYSLLTFIIRLEVQSWQKTLHSNFTPTKAFQDHICMSLPQLILSYCLQTIKQGKTNNQPRIHSKSFLEALGHEGLNKMLDSFDDRSAEAVCTFAFSNGPGEEPLIFQGRTLVCLSLSWRPLWIVSGYWYWCRAKSFLLEDRQILVCLVLIYKESRSSMWFACKFVLFDWPTDSHNVGWDPIFEYEGKTYAEMDKEEKVSETSDNF